MNQLKNMLKKMRRNSFSFKKFLIIIFVLIGTVKGLTQSHSGWFRLGTGMRETLDKPTNYCIKVGNIKTEVYFYQNKYCYIECKLGSKVSVWRRVYIYNKSKLIKCR